MYYNGRRYTVGFVVINGQAGRCFAAAAFLAKSCCVYLSEPDLPVPLRPASPRFVALRVRLPRRGSSRSRLPGRRGAGARSQDPPSPFPPKGGLQRAWPDPDHGDGRPGAAGEPPVPLRALRLRGNLETSNQDSCGLISWGIGCILQEITSVR